MPGNLELPPPEVIAAWPAPNHVNPERRAWMPAFSGTLQAVTTLLVVTRLILRAQRRAGGLGIDDAMLFLGFLAGTMFTCVAILGAGQYGFDRHIYDIDFTKVTETALIAWLSQLAFLVAYCIAFVGVLIGGCRPVNAYWRAYDPVYAASVEYTCIPTKFLNPLSGGLSVVSDFYAVVLPIGLLWHLKISKRQRYALNAVFSLGFVVVIVGIVRTVSFLRSNTVLDSNTGGISNMSFRESADGAKILSTFQVEQWSVRDGDFGSLILGKAEQEWTTVHEIEVDEITTMPERTAIRTASEYEALALEDIKNFKASNLYSGWRNSSENSSEVDGSSDRR
ncbi:uncharacterized protein MYCGRDRAFT_93126 [Zymoseptoria tritici IPO323]|uniref:Rhodopsin domain-containing protein n=1 Tax=Zymoseptoria tritici (strain CBS 115943 / IPO323) TaxID=336722 RepID=F9XBM4_ZYMTI|nr:uncharacterized protein MYCGRDRAFT_93126 [Zymoseptoria tritici IPO323]EGP87111.1 hypothetical protein MYCGRDRAFT_93126 [Zymoseptoria tritici IPO323]